jgi:hypothetical protein
LKFTDKVVKQKKKLAMQKDIIRKLTGSEQTLKNMMIEMQQAHDEERAELKRLVNAAERENQSAKDGQLSTLSA